MKAKDAKPGDLLMIGEKWENICPVLSDNWRGSGNGEINVLRFVSLWLANRMFSGKTISMPGLYLGFEYGNFEISHHKTKKHHKILIDSKILIFSGYDFRYFEVQPE